MCSISDMQIKLQSQISKDKSEDKVIQDEEGLGKSLSPTSGSE